MKRLGAHLLLLLLAAGCESTTTSGDGHSDDALPDPGMDPVTDESPDSGIDPEEDPAIDRDATPDTPNDDPIDHIDDGMEVPPDTPADAPDSCPFSGIWLSAHIYNVEWPWEVFDIERECTITDVYEDVYIPEIETIDLRCMTEDGGVENPIIEINSSLSVLDPSIVGTDVTLRFVEQAWYGEWMTLRLENGEILIAYVDAQNLTPDGIDPGDWYSPLDIVATGDLCALFLDPSACYDREPLALDITWDPSAVRIFNNNEDWLGTGERFHIIVTTALKFQNIRCTDMPSGSFRTLFIRHP